MCEDDVTVIIEPTENLVTIVIDDNCEEVTIIAEGLGAPGLSAYDIAVANGFVGTEEEWIESLQGIGVPTGGTAGMQLFKTTATDYDTQWAYSWEYLVANWSVIPTFNAAITGGDVYNYELNGTLRYRFVPTTYTPTQDAFYSTFNGTSVTGLITKRG
jgi:hypothetical protein